MARKARKCVKIAKEIGDRRVGKVLEAIFLEGRRLTSVTQRLIMK